MSSYGDYQCGVLEAGNTIDIGAICNNYEIEVAAAAKSSARWGDVENVMTAPEVF